VEPCRRTCGILVIGCALAALSAGCAREDLSAQRGRLEREHKARMEELEALEIRLVTVGARQRAWSELQERHTRISAIACQNAAEHVSAMKLHDEKQRAKRRRARTARLEGAQARVDTSRADAGPVTADASAPGQ